MSPGLARKPGDRVGPFEIVEYLASGGMGDVYVGRDLRDGTLAAIKFVRELSTASAVRFQREVRLAEALHHPHIVEGRGSGTTEDGASYLATELLRGTDLATRLETNGLAPAEVVQLALQMCDALAYASAQGVIHRDLKPENIFLCEGPALHAKILDFGIARVRQDRAATQTGNIVGTLLYMSPEQARGDRALDPRSDLWSLGVVLYAALAGRLPFESETGPGTLFQILVEPAPPIEAVRNDLPRELNAVVRRTLAKSREDRFRDARAMRDALLAIDPALFASLPPRSMGAHAVSLAPTASNALEASAPTAAMSAMAGTVENRLVSVVFLRGVRDAAWIDSLAPQFDARTELLRDGDTIVLFGHERWHGDEPFRAVRFASASVQHARAVGVATGRVLRDTLRVTGEAVDAAAAIVAEGAVALDATTASFVEHDLAIERLADGSARVVVSHHGAGGPTRTHDEGSFFGREVERKLVASTIERADGERQLSAVVITAAAGLGKTRLLDQCITDARDAFASVTILRAGCDRRRRDTPFSVLRDAFATVVDPRVVAVLSSTSPNADPVAGLDRARSAVDTILRDLCESGPVILALDDAQWLDASTRSTIHWLHETVNDLPLAIWLFARPEGRESVVAAAPGASVVDLPLLSARDAQRMLSSQLGEAPQALLDRAGGHPLFLEELAKVYAQHGARSLSRDVALPVSIQGALLAQLDQMDPIDREFVKRAAVVGQPFWLEAVTALGGEADAATRLRRNGLVTAQPRARFEGTREFTFRTRLLVDVAYDLWTGEQRTRLHALTAEWLSQRSNAAADEIARHWDAAGDRDRAADAHAKAAESAAAVADTETVLTHAERVLALTSDPATRWRALVAKDAVLELGGDPEARRAGLDEMSALVATLGTSACAQYAWRRCQFARLTGDATGARAAGESAIRFAKAADDLRWACDAHYELALLAANRREHDDADEHAREAGVIADRIGESWLIARAAFASGFVAVATSNFENGLASYLEAAALYGRFGDRRRESQSRSNAGDVMLQLGRVAEAAVQIEGALAAAQKCGNARTARAATHNLGVCRRLTGDLDGARRLQLQALDDARGKVPPRVLAAIAEEIAMIAFERNESLDEPIALAERARDAAVKAGFPDAVATMKSLLVRIRSRHGSLHADAVDEVRGLASTIPDATARAMCRVAILEASEPSEENRARVREALSELGTLARDSTTRDDIVAAFSTRMRIPADLRAG